MLLKATESPRQLVPGLLQHNGCDPSTAWQKKEYYFLFFTFLANR